MKDGAMFPIPYLNYTTNNQEGRHRMFAFKMVNGSDAKAPVLIITPTKDVSEEEIEDYCKRRWGNYWKDFFDTIKNRYIESDEDENDEDLEVDDSSDFDEDELNDIISAEVEDDLNSLNNEEDELQWLSRMSGKSVDELMDLNMSDFIKLVDKYS